MAITDEEHKGVGDIAKDTQYGHEHERDSDEFETSSQTSGTQAGVKKVEAISASWTVGGLVVAYVT